MGWILIFYMAGYSVGGPATARFNDKLACDYAREQIAKSYQARVGNFPGICVPESSLDIPKKD